MNSKTMEVYNHMQQPYMILWTFCDKYRHLLTSLWRTQKSKTLFGNSYSQVVHGI